MIQVQKYMKGKQIFIFVIAAVTKFILLQLWRTDIFIFIFEIEDDIASNVNTNVSLW